MSILGIAAGVLGGGGIIGTIGLAIFAPGLLARLAGAVMNFVGSVNWAKIWWILPIAAAIVWGFIQRGEARHWQKVDAGDVAERHRLEHVLGGVKAEVDRGVGKATRAEDAAFYIRRFVDNVNILKAALDREEAGIRAAHADADQARADAHALGQTTPAQRQREKDRLKIIGAAGALKPEEWEKL